MVLGSYLIWRSMPDQTRLVSDSLYADPGQKGRLRSASLLHYETRPCRSVALLHPWTSALLREVGEGGGGRECARHVAGRSQFLDHPFKVWAAFLPGPTGSRRGRLRVSGTRSSDCWSPDVLVHGAFASNDKGIDLISEPDGFWTTYDVTDVVLPATPSAVPRLLVQSAVDVGGEHVHR